MAYAPLLTQVSGQSVSGVKAELPGHRLFDQPRACHPWLHRDEVSVSGIIADTLDQPALDRIAYYATGLGYVADICDVIVEGKPRTVTMYRPEAQRPESGEDWRAGDWREKWGQIAVFAAEEVIQHHGVIPPDILAKMMPMIEVRAAARVAATKPVPTDIRSNMSADGVEILAQNNSHAGFFLTREFTLRHPEFSGGMSAPVKREVFVATDAAIVLPYDPVRDRVLLVEQFRMGPFGRGDPHPWMLEPVAGRVDPDETPEETAHRECVEEAGLALQRLEHIASHYCSLGCSTEYFHCYLGICDLPDLRTGTGGLESEDEDIRTHVLTFERAHGADPDWRGCQWPIDPEPDLAGTGTRKVTCCRLKLTPPAHKPWGR